MTLYIYRTDNNKVVAEYLGDTNAECEAQATADGYAHSEDFGWTYTPAFGTNDGLIA